MGDGDGNPAGGAEGQTGPDVRRPHGGLAVAGGVQDAVGGSRGAQPTAGGGQAAQHRAGGKAGQVLPLGGGGAVQHREWWARVGRCEAPVVHLNGDDGADGRRQKCGRNCIFFGICVDDE